MRVCSHVLLFFFFKQKTAYEMRISDWSSDVCSSDLQLGDDAAGARRTDQADMAMTEGMDHVRRGAGAADARQAIGHAGAEAHPGQIGRASCRERVGQYV